MSGFGGRGGASSCRRSRLLVGAHVLRLPARDSRESAALAEGAAAGRLEGARHDVRERHVVDRRMARLEHAMGACGLGDKRTAEHDADAPARRLNARRAGIVADGFGHRRHRAAVRGAPVPTSTPGLHASGYGFGGISTLLMTWMTPFEAMTSALITCAPPT